MDKNTIIGLFLLFALIIGYSIYISPSKEQIAEQQRIRDSIAAVQQAELEEQMAAEAMATAKMDSLVQEVPAEVDSVQQLKKMQSLYGFFTQAAAENESSPDIIVENDKYIFTIDKKGGQISSVTLKDVYTYDSLPVVLFEKGNNDNRFGFTFFSNYIEVHTYDLNFQAYQLESENIKVSGSDSVEISMRLYPDDVTEENQSYIEFLYTVRGNDYLTALAVHFVNMEKYINATQTQMELTWQEQLIQQEKNRKDEMTASTVYFSDTKDVDNLKEAPDRGDSTASTTSLKWISFKQLFFTSSLIADDKFASAVLVTALPEKADARALKNMKAKLTMPFEGKNPSMSMNFYFGPNKYRQLKSYDIKMEKQIQLGGVMVAWVNRWIVIPIFNWLESFGINYGIIILILTIILKGVLTPVTYRNYISSAKMRAVKPEIDEIAQRYPKQEDAMKKQQATMELYKRFGIKPMAGCLPMLIQFPILVAMFRFFPSSYELRQQSFLWAKDLSTYDAIVSWNTHIPLISGFYGNHVSLFTLLMTLATIGYTYMNNKMMAPTGVDSQQQKMMKWMMYLMPIMFLGIFNNYSAGLSYYYLLVNLITFLQMGLFRIFIKEDKIRQQLLMAQKTAQPVKKSKWQQRMEEMMKQQQAMAAQQRGAAGLPPTKRRHNTSETPRKKK